MSALNIFSLYPLALARTVRAMNGRATVFTYGATSRTSAAKPTLPAARFRNAQSSFPAWQKDTLAALTRPGHSGHDDGAEERRHQ